MAAVENEIKLAAAAGFELPDLTGVVDDAVVRPVAALELDATYYDTADLRLARAGVTLRNRIDRADDTSEWTAKFPTGTAGTTMARHEIDVVAPPGVVPDELAALLVARVRTAPIAPVARLVTNRRRLVIDVHGAPTAEIDDDSVVVLRELEVVDTFREIEVENVTDAAGADAVLEAVAHRLQAAGASPPDTVPKLVRALGDRASAPPELTAPKVGKRASAADVLRAAMASSTQRVIDQHHVIHLDADPEGVHQARVGLRRIRSDLRTMRPLVDRPWAESLRDEVRWLAGELGRVRDADVLLARIGAAVDRLLEGDRTAASALVERARDERAAAQHQLVGVLASERYLALLDRLVDAAINPRLRPAADDRARRVLRPLVAKAWRRLRTAVRGLGDTPSDADLHRVRIRAKQARYAADVAASALGAPARRHAAAVADLQDVLGDVHDAAVTEAWLRQSGRTARGGRAIAVGLLIADQRHAADSGRHQWPKAWKAAGRKKRTRWLAKS